MSSTKQFILSFLICLVAFSALAFGLSKFMAKDDAQVDPIIGTEVGEQGGSSESEIISGMLSSSGESVCGLVVGLDPVDPQKPEIDALIVVKADVSGKKLYVCSIPTDTKYEISGTYLVDGEKQDYTYTMSFKETVINRSEDLSDYTDGLEYLAGKISALTGLNIEYYAALNGNQAATVFNRFTGGGLEDYIVPEPMKYDADPKYNEETGETEYDYSGNLDINLYEGVHEPLTGAKAVGLSRYLDYYSGDGQTNRCSTQVDLIESFVKTALTSENSFKTELLGFDNPLSIFGISAKNTNITTADIIKHLDLAFSLSEYEFISVPFRYNNIVKNDKVSSLRENFQ